MGGLGWGVVAGTCRFICQCEGFYFHFWVIMFSCPIAGQNLLVNCVPWRLLFWNFQSHDAGSEDKSITAGEFLDSHRSCQAGLGANNTNKSSYNGGHGLQSHETRATYLLLGFEDQTWSSGPAASLRRSPAAAPVKRPRLWGSAPPLPPCLAASCPPSKNAKITAETQRRSPSLMQSACLQQVTTHVDETKPTFMLLVVTGAWWLGSSPNPPALHGFSSGIPVPHGR